MWIALNYVSLKSWIQQFVEVSWYKGVVNCFELCIFEKLNTTEYKKLKETFRCELLWIMYLWKVEYNDKSVVPPQQAVVNCFELCIFEKLNTTTKIWNRHSLCCELLWIMYLWKVEYNNIIHEAYKSVLWIALNYVSLKSWIQLEFITIWQRKSCELLWIMYLWKVEYNSRNLPKSKSDVVNCFELCIFEKLNTTHVTKTT